MSFATFDRQMISLKPLNQRSSDLDLSVIKPLIPPHTISDTMQQVGKAIRKARKNNAEVVLMMGAHVLRAGMQHCLIDLMEKGWITCIAVNGACIIHDFELALTGKTTESVAYYIKDGSFGMWEETSRLNQIVSEGAKRGLGLGYAVGEAIDKGDYPNKAISVVAAAYRLNIPLTVHVGIGYDIVYQHPNCDGAAYGATSYKDFLTFTHCLENLENGVLMNFGTAVMGPEVFLKSLSMARHKAGKEGRSIGNFTTLVCDLMPLPADTSKEAEKSEPAYFFRPYKTLLVRTVSNGGKSYYEQGDHKNTVPQLWASVVLS